MTWIELRRKLYIAAPLVGIPVLAAVVLYQHCKTLPEAEKTIGVNALDFTEPVEKAMGLWNKAADCIIFVPGDDVLYQSDNGEPCGLAFHPAISDGHSATTYQCEEGYPHRFAVHVNLPGDLRTQTCIALHELGHVLGLNDSENPRSTMHTEWCPEDGKVLWPDDKSAKRVSEEFCP